MDGLANGPGGGGYGGSHDGRERVISKVKLLSILGTRPEAIKMAPVVKRLENDARFVHHVVVTGQHRDMLDQALQTFDIVPKHDLNVMQPNQRLTDVMTRCLQGLAPILAEERPDMVLVHGDTLTAFAAGVAAFFHQIPVGHVEAGLRTGRMDNPFPEEMNRRLLGGLASLHFAPTAGAKENLIAEGVAEQSIYVVGNTVIDALLTQVQPDYRFEEPSLEQFNDRSKRMILVTTHRRENLGQAMQNVYIALRSLAERLPDVDVVFPLHKNPEVRRVARECLAGNERIHLIEPPDYRTFANLMARATLILTDSGGIQEEAPALGRPVVLLRETTERPEGVAAGTCVVVGTDSKVIEQTAWNLLTDKNAYASMAQAKNPYGDGHAARRIHAVIAYTFGLEPQRPTEFT